MVPAVMAIAPPRRRALVVAPTNEIAALVIARLCEEGFHVECAADFGEGRNAIDANPPDLLVTELKLGAFNGLHLVIRARLRGGGTRAIVIGGPDMVLEREAEREQARYLVVPISDLSFTEAVRGALAESRCIRRSPRRHVRSTEARIGDVRVLLLDVSDDGLRFELATGDGDSLPPFFTLTVSRFDIACRMRCVWRAPGPEAGRIWCGAVLDPLTQVSSTAWHRLVRTK